jgi:hypothetical protein
MWGPSPQNTLALPRAESAVPRQASDGRPNTSAGLDVIELAPPGYDREAPRPDTDSAWLDGLERGPPAFEKGGPAQ